MMMIGFAVDLCQLNQKIYQFMEVFMSIFHCRLLKIRLDMLQIKEFLMQNCQRKIGNPMFSNFMLEIYMILSQNWQLNTMLKHLLMAFAAQLQKK